MRTFISIEIPEEARKKFIPVNKFLRNSALSLKFVKTKNLHFTLKFLGEISEEESKGVIETCQSIGQQFLPFSLGLKSVGVFPGVRKARVIWVGVDEGRETLKEISKFLEEKLEKRGFPAGKREFQGHLTLARIKKMGEGKEFLENLIAEFKDKKFCSFPVDKFYLMSSELKKEGPNYAVLKEIPLTGDQ